MSCAKGCIDRDAVWDTELDGSMEPCMCILVPSGEYD